jgi:hypothetical protein
MNLVPKEILMSHLQRSEGAEEVSLPIDFLRDLLYQAMPRTWVGLPTVVILDIYAETLKEHRGGSMPDGQIAFAKAIEQALKERNT